MQYQEEQEDENRRLAAKWIDNDNVLKAIKDMHSIDFTLAYFREKIFL